MDMVEKTHIGSNTKPPQKFVHLFYPLEKFKISKNWAEVFTHRPFKNAFEFYFTKFSNLSPDTNKTILTAIYSSQNFKE